MVLWISKTGPTRTGRGGCWGMRENNKGLGLARLGFLVGRPGEPCLAQYLTKGVYFCTQLSIESCGASTYSCTGNDRVLRDPIGGGCRKVPNRHDRNASVLKS